MDPILSHGEQTPTAEKPANAKASKDISERKSFTPDLQVLKASQLSKRGERYLSPTDLLISPISRRLLAKNRKGVDAIYSGLTTIAGDSNLIILKHGEVFSLEEIDCFSSD